MLLLCLHYCLLKSRAPSLQEAGFCLGMRIYLLMVQDPKTCCGTGRMPRNDAFMVVLKLLQCDSSVQSQVSRATPGALEYPQKPCGASGRDMGPTRDLWPSGMSAGCQTGCPGLSQLVSDDCAQANESCPLCQDKQIWTVWNA